MRKLWLVLVTFLLLAFIIGGIGCLFEGEEPTPEPSQSNYIYTDGIIEVGGDGEPIELINNPYATNPTYSELLAFIEEDPTDKYTYIFGPPKVAYVCSDFAEDVHNNAEAAGIRSAWVGIDIAGNSEGHALNAFETTDLGLVYIDCTGEGLWNISTSTSGSWDNRAYVDIGEQYGIKYINKVKPWFSFAVKIQGHFKPRENWESVKPGVLEWLETHDIEKMGQEWIADWLRENEANLNQCGRMVEPVRIGYGFTGSFTVSTPQQYWKSSSIQWRMDVDCIDAPWIQLHDIVVTVDGMTVVYSVGLVSTWTEPLGIVKDIHIHW